MSRELSLTFAGMLFGHLLGPKSIGSRREKSGQLVYWTFGSLVLRAHGENSGQTVGVNLLVRENWASDPPECRVMADFIRPEGDWHYRIDGTLCYVLQREWDYGINKFSHTNPSPDQFLRFAAGWCLSAIDSLVVRHLIGHRLSLETWPPKWLDYAHGIEGDEQFEVGLALSKRRI
jgi:hypothetical protein